MKLNQVVALVKDRKQVAKDKETAVYQALQKPDSFDGFERTFVAVHEGELVPPPESKKIIFEVEKLLADLVKPWSTAVDTILTQDLGNQKATANVSVDINGSKLNLTSVPATHLIYLEKTLVDLETMLSKAPVLDPALNWAPDEATTGYRASPTSSFRTKKVPKVVVAAPATDKHPAQTHLLQEDINALQVNTTQLSGRITQARKNQMLERVVALREAVVKAREEANSQEIDFKEEGRQILDFIFKA